MVSSSMDIIIKSAVNHKKSKHMPSLVGENSWRKSEMCNKKISEKLRNRTLVKNNVLRNLNSAIFAMLLQRTTFTVLVIMSIIFNPTVSASEVTISKNNNTVIANLNVPSDVVIQSSPVYIPLTDTSSSSSSTSSSSSSTTEKTIVKEIIKENNEKIKPSNRSFNTGNSLWDGFLNQCLSNPSLSCIQKNVYTYLDGRLGFNGDVNITDGLKFKRNKLAYWKYTEKANKKSAGSDETRENEVDIDEDDETGRYSESPIEEVTDALYNKGVGFMMSHDMELKLPQIFFDGAVLKVSPRSIEGTGALVHLDFLPSSEVVDNGQGRIFFKKIKKYIKSKVLMGILAIVLIVKLIKLKLFFFLPLLIGVANAKKLFLKLVLFVFPAVGHIFKLCSWYHDNYHSTKYHHHHHQISHIHGGYPGSGHTGYPYGPSGSPHTVEVHGGYPPSGSVYGHEQPGWEFSGPGLGSEYIVGDIHRNSVAFSPKPEDASEINSWGLGSSSTQNQAFTKAYSSYYDDQRFVRAAVNAQAGNNRNNIIMTPQGPPFTSARHPNQINTQAEKDALLRAAQRQQQEQLRISQAQQVLRQQAEQKLALQKQLQSQNFKPSVQELNLSPVYDAFYSPILQKIDQVFNGMNIDDEPCRERLICSMYKNPMRFSPHSNIISNELSRDANDLQKPESGSTAAIRFYKYVQAAREGQDKKDCLSLFPICAIDTEN